MPVLENRVSWTFPRIWVGGGGGGGVGEVTLPSHPFCISACLPVMMMVEASMPLIEIKDKIFSGTLT